MRPLRPTTEAQHGAGKPRPYAAPVMGYVLLRHAQSRVLDGLELSNRARLMLYVIASAAHDTGTGDVPPHTYFGGWEWLAAVALGYEEYTPVAKRATARALAELVDDGLVKVDDMSPGHKRRGYVVTL